MSRSQQAGGSSAWPRWGPGLAGGTVAWLAGTTLAPAAAAGVAAVAQQECGAVEAPAPAAATLPCACVCPLPHPSLNTHHLHSPQSAAYYEAKKKLRALRQKAEAQVA